MKRFTEREKALIEELWYSYVLVEDIAKQIPDHNADTIRQYIFHAGLRRDVRITKLVSKYGMECLLLGDSAEEIRKNMNSIAMEERQALADEFRARTEAALAQMSLDLQNGMPKKLAFAKARNEGCTLQQVGDVVGLTRERVRQLTKKLEIDVPKPPLGVRAPYKSEITPRSRDCKACGNPFMISTRGNHVYCPTCKPIKAKERRQRAAQTYYIKHPNMKAAAKAWRENNPEKVKEYNRKNKLAAKKRGLVERLKQLEPEDREEIVQWLKGAGPSPC